MTTDQLQEKTSGRLRALAIAKQAMLTNLREKLEKRKQEELEWVRQFQEAAATTQAQLDALEEELEEFEEESLKNPLPLGQLQEEFGEMEWRRKLSEMTEEQLQAMVPATPALAALVEEELDEREWDRIVAQPGSQEFLQKLADETKAAIAAGEIEEGELDYDEE